MVKIRISNKNNKITMSTDKVSIVMTAFNSEKYIKTAVSTILNQTYENFELLVVNDASKDNTLEILKSFNDSRLKILDSSRNSGTYYSRNLGMFHSKGDYIAFVDSDDMTSPNRFTSIIDYMEKNKEVLHIETRYFRFYEETGDLWFRDWTRGVGFPVIRREVMDEIGFFLPVRANGDMEYAQRIKNHFGKHTSKIINDFTYWATQGSSNLTVKIVPNGPERIDFQDYAFNVFHKSGNTYVAFPFENELLSNLKHLKLFSNSILNGESNINIIESTGVHIVEKEDDELLKLLYYSEKLNNEFYSKYLFYKSAHRKIKIQLANIKEVNSDKTNTVSNLEDQKSNNKQSFYESDLLNETREKGLNYYKNIPTWWKRIRSIIRHLKQ